MVSVMRTSPFTVMLGQLKTTPVHLVELRAAALLKMESRCDRPTGGQQAVLAPVPLTPLPHSSQTSATSTRKMIRNGAEVSPCPKGVLKAICAYLSMLGNLERGRAFTIMAVLDMGAQVTILLVDWIQLMGCGQSSEWGRGS